MSKGVDWWARDRNDRAGGGCGMGDTPEASILGGGGANISFCPLNNFDN